MSEESKRLLHDIFKAIPERSRASFLWEVFRSLSPSAKRDFLTTLHLPTTLADTPEVVSKQALITTSSKLDDSFVDAGPAETPNPMREAVQNTAGLKPLAAKPSTNNPFTLVDTVAAPPTAKDAKEPVSKSVEPPKQTELIEEEFNKFLSAAGAEKEGEPRMSSQLIGCLGLGLLASIVIVALSIGAKNVFEQLKTLMGF